MVASTRGAPDEEPRERAKRHRQKSPQPERTEKSDSRMLLASTKGATGAPYVASTAPVEEDGSTLASLAAGPTGMAASALAGLRGLTRDTTPSSLELRLNRKAAELRERGVSGYPGMALSAVGQLVPMVGMALVPGVGPAALLGTGGLAMAGEVTSELEERGADVGSIQQAAVLSAVVGGALEKLGAGKIAGRAISRMSGGTKVGKLAGQMSSKIRDGKLAKAAEAVEDFVDSAVAEGQTEWAQSQLNSGLAFAFDENSKLFSVDTFQGFLEAQKRALLEGSLGSVGGGVVGAAGGTLAMMAPETTHADVARSSTEASATGKRAPDRSRADDDVASAGNGVEGVEMDDVRRKVFGTAAPVDQTAQSQRVTDETAGIGAGSPVPEGSQKIPEPVARTRKMVKAANQAADQLQKDTESIVSVGGSLAHGTAYANRQADSTTGNADIVIRGMQGVSRSKGRTSMNAPAKLRNAVSTARRNARSVGVPLDIYVEHDGSLWRYKQGRLMRDRRKFRQEFWSEPKFRREHPEIFAGVTAPTLTEHQVKLQEAVRKQEKGEALERPEARAVELAIEETAADQLIEQANRRKGIWFSKDDPIAPVSDPTKPMDPSKGRTRRGIKYRDRRSANALQSYMLWSARPQRLMRALDGFMENGPFMRLFWRPLSNSWYRAQERQARTQQKFFNFAAEASQGDPAWLENTLGREVVSPSSGRSFNGAERIGIYMLSERVDSTAKLVEDNLIRSDGSKSDPLSPDEMAEIRDGLSGAERRFVDFFRQHYDEMAPVISKAYFEATGNDLPILEKYFPNIGGEERVDLTILKQDPSGQLMPDGSVSDEIFGVNPQQAPLAISRGFTRERIPGARQDLMIDSINVFMRNARQADFYVEMAPTLSRVVRLRNRADVREAFARKGDRDLAWFGKRARPDLNSWMNKWLEDVGRQGVKQSDSMIEAGFKWARVNAAPAMLMMKAGVAMKQATSSMIAAADAGYIRPILSGWQEVFSSAHSAFRRNQGKGREHWFDGSLVSEMEAKFPFIKHRRLERELEDLAAKQRSRGRLIDGSKYTRFKQRAQQAGLAGIMGIDKLTIVAVAKGVYDTEYHAARARGLDDNAADALATTKTSELLERTQPAAAPKDLPQIFRETSELAKAFTIFNNQINQNLNLHMEMLQRGREGKLSKKEAAMWVGYGLVMPVLYISLVDRAGDLRDEEVAHESIGQTLGTLPVMNAIVSSGLYAMRTGQQMQPEDIASFSLQFSGPARAVRGARKIARGELAMGAAETLAGIATTAGYPGDAVKNVIEGAQDYVAGRARGPGAIDMGPIQAEPGIEDVPLVGEASKLGRALLFSRYARTAPTGAALRKKKPTPGLKPVDAAGSFKPVSTGGFR